MYLFFFFNDTATTEIYSLSLHDALPISSHFGGPTSGDEASGPLLEPSCRRSLRRLPGLVRGHVQRGDRKSTRLNSSHANISYAVFCLKKKKTLTIRILDYYIDRAHVSTL